MVHRRVTFLNKADVLGSAQAKRWHEEIALLNVNRPTLGLCGEKQLGPQPDSACLFIAEVAVKKII
jgi:hypothetical protein